MLCEGEAEAAYLLPSGSNYVFVLVLRFPDVSPGLAVYKPRQGEAPLWDFPAGTLYRREYAAYLVARAGGWDFVPPTVVRDGPQGVGAVQLFIDHDPRQNIFTFGAEREAEIRDLAAFDLVANNADRKAGHCLLDAAGRMWAIDHGLTFHTDHKLRTVLWDFAGQPVADASLVRMRRVLEALKGDDLRSELGALLHPAEVAALRARCERLLEQPTYPQPGGYRPYPWPPV